MKCQGLLTLVSHPRCCTKKREGDLSRNRNIFSITLQTGRRLQKLLLNKRTYDVGNNTGGRR